MKIFLYLQIMVVLNNETVNLIKQDIDLGNIVFAGSTIAQYIESKNPHENITLALKSIKEDLKEILSQYPESFYFGQIHFSILYEVFNELGWQVDFDAIKTSNLDYEVTVDIPNRKFYYELNCSWFRPGSYLEKNIR